MSKTAEMPVELVTQPLHAIGNRRFLRESMPAAARTKLAFYPPFESSPPIPERPFA